MKIDVEPFDVEQTVNLVSKTHYEGNLTVAKIDYDRRFNGTVWTTFTLKVYDNRGPGARRSPTGRHNVAACWHAYYAVLRDLMTTFTHARVRTSWYSANGLFDWEQKAEDSRQINVGSIREPVLIVDLCDCESDE